MTPTDASPSALPPLRVQVGRVRLAAPNHFPFEFKLRFGAS
jgi:hypothetical protein